MSNQFMSLKCVIERLYQIFELLTKICSILCNKVLGFSLEKIYNLHPLAFDLFSKNKILQRFLTVKFERNLCSLLSRTYFLYSIWAHLKSYNLHALYLDIDCLYFFYQKPLMIFIHFHTFK